MMRIENSQLGAICEKYNLITRFVQHDEIGVWNTKHIFIRGLDGKFARLSRSQVLT